jgi:large subunit ribosomal protein L25
VRRAPFVLRQAIRKPSVLAQPYPCRDGVREGDAATWRLRPLRRAAWPVATIVVRPRVEALGKVWALAQRWNQQQHGTAEPKEVHPGDHQHQLSVARHRGVSVARHASLVEGRSLPSCPAMATTDTTVLAVAHRDPGGSREARRLRRAGNVPGVVYGGGEDPIAFQVDARLLRQALAHAGAVLDLEIDGADGTPVVLKDLARHPVTGETIHVDLLRVRLDVAIETTVVLELVGAENSPATKDGGVFEQVTRELTIEALPAEIPDSVQHDVSELHVGDTVTLDALAAPPSVKFVDDPETVIVTVSAPRLQLVDENEIEEETEVVGEEGEEAAEGAPAPEAGGEGEPAPEQ